MKALYFDRFGGPEVLQYGALPDPSLSDNDVLVKMSYIGLNFADIYRRKGTYHIEKRVSSPYIDGYEGLGMVIAVGKKVTKHQLGEKVFFVDVPFANAELVAVPEDHAIEVPSDLDNKVIACAGLQGLTADFLAHDLGRNRPGQNVFIHGISGGVGQILSQMLTADGINVYGVTSTKAKQKIAFDQGAKAVFLRTDPWLQNWLERFDTVYDGVGITLEQSIELLKHRGNLVFFGMAGGNPPRVDLVTLLSQSKSILTGDLWDYLTDYWERIARSKRLFNYFTDEKIKVSEPTVFPLKDGILAHKLLESGNNVGKILLKP
ncbi:zinc-binding dehydrogenase [Lentilactobacillus hilgardii]|uniref:zinc-binding dehydrogenase n=1 Tax=Lentilactobacillus hilgardii TaxID=1588 RepID=UPI0039E78763